MADLERDFDLVDYRLPPTCHHPNLVPLELQAGKRTWESGNWYVDWTSNIINAHFVIVTKFWCPTCGEILNPPSDTPDQ